MGSVFGLNGEVIGNCECLFDIMSTNKQNNAVCIFHSTNKKTSKQTE